jgi:hypothetical protein
MKALVLATGLLLLVGFAGLAVAQVVVMGPPLYGAPYVPAPYPYAGYGYPGYPGYPYYPYPLPPAPSLGFGRGGIYGHAFIGRGDGVTAYTLPGYQNWYR